jgi:hypothetical protein
MKIQKTIFKLLLISFLIISCSEETTIPEIEGNFTNGIIISTEGNFGAKDGSISYINNDLNRLATNFLYTGVNNAQLGGLIQSVTFSDNFAYIILNDVNVITVVDKNTFEKVVDINTGLSNPRYMTIVNGKGYITNWGSGFDETDDYVAVLNLESNTIEDTIISLENGVEQIVSKDNKLYVSHKGAFSSGNIISVVDLSANNAITKITVKDNPDELFFDISGNLVVLSEGRPTSFGGAPDFAVLTNTTSAISIINTNTNTIEKEWTFPENTRASLMAYENGTIYYYMSATKEVFSLEESSTTLPSSGITVTNIYGMNVKDNRIYTVKFAFTSLSEFSVIDIATENEIYKTPVGLGASKIYFN